ncbi:hypothetical protein JTE90_015113 [Oedothorax gibbosus]|uniref:tRNA selenocysteine-associated protein 1 n=1 Tax=Oedothorax gibbosus TaxID=931172 RepID=A0AAV6VT21_9ARAC|nr:hypothetical protein JTE90_015113 [Oedothorax gibbosus]
MNRKSTVWIGDLDSNIDEEFLVDAFRILGEPICSVKIIRKNTESLCYGFLDFPDEESAHRVLHRYNGKLIPNTSSKRFKLNHANYSKDSSLEKDYSLFVGDLGEDVDDLALFDAFVARYKTVKLAKVIYDNFGVSKGYGFVHFTSKTEYESALVEMQNAHIGSKSVRVSTAQQKSRTSVPSTPGSEEQQQWQQQYPGYDYQSYYAAWQTYQAQNPYYGYDQRYGAYGTAYQYPQQYPYADPQAATTTAETTPTAVPYAPSTYEIPETSIEEHDIPLDIDQMNQELMQRNEELYTALDESRWLPTENLDPPLIRLK